MEKTKLFNSEEDRELWIRLNAERWEDYRVKNCYEPRYKKEVYKEEDIEWIAEKK
jgi:hypothetical protein